MNINVAKIPIGPLFVFGLICLIGVFCVGQKTVQAQTQQRTETIRLIDHKIINETSSDQGMLVFCDAPRQTIVYVVKMGNGKGISTMFRPDICK